MFLRAYRSEDKRSLQQLFFDTVHAVNAPDFTPEQLAAWAPSEPDRSYWSRLDAQFCFVVESQRLPVGFVSVYPDGRLDCLYVHPDFQGKGIATALYKQVERLARKRGFTTLRTLSGLTARSFFEKKGFLMQNETREIWRNVEFRLYNLEKVLEPPTVRSRQEQSQVRPA